MKLYVITPPPELLEFYWGKPTLLTCEKCDRPVERKTVFFKSFVISVTAGQETREMGYWMAPCAGCGDGTILNNAVQVSR